MIDRTFPRPKKLLKGGFMMQKIKRDPNMFLAAGLIILAFLISFPHPASGQAYPDKAITIYCGYAAGASTDVTARALAQGAEKLLGVPVVVENKIGGGGTVATALVAGKKPDGYSLGVVGSGVLTVSPHLIKLAYNPLKDFTVIMQYTRFMGGLCVLSESPIKTIDEFIAYAKGHPGLSYGSPGMYTFGHLATEFFRECKGLSFKHMPTGGGAEAVLQLLGKHTDFTAGAGQHLTYVRQGLFRMLLLYKAGERDLSFPDVPTLKGIGCPNAPVQDYIVMGPKGIPGAISRKLDETFKKVTEGPDFQKVLANFDLPYDYKNQAQMEKEIAAEYEWYRTFLKRVKAPQ
jgi:tripartite-type tricarboxylate transporter receptor subunit TctC